MNDCTNAEMRDQLPDLLHERLDASARAAVMAHVDDCVDCRDELQLLRDVRGAFDRATPRVDVAYVVGGLPLPPTRAVAPAARRRVWADWRVAAAVTLIVAGGSSLAVMRSGSGSPESPVTGTQRVAVTPAPVVSSPVVHVDQPAATVAPKSAAPVSAPATEPVTDARLTGLDEQQLRTLLGDIENLKPVPVAEPEPVMIRVSGTSSEGI